jgi:uncharacterized membrane protein
MGLSPLGILHTAIGVVALASGAIALARYKEISPRTQSGRVYLATTLLTAVTALFLFAHGTFGPPHVLAILTLVALALGTIAKSTPIFGSAWRSVRAALFTLTLLFHLIPAVTESLTRLPPGAPLVGSAEAPLFQKIYPVLLALYIAGAIAQIRWLRSHRSGMALSP